MRVLDSPCRWLRLQKAIEREKGKCERCQRMCDCAWILTCSDSIRVETLCIKSAEAKKSKWACQKPSNAMAITACVNSILHLQITTDVKAVKKQWQMVEISKSKTNKTNLIFNVLNHIRWKNNTQCQLSLQNQKVMCATTASWEHFAVC